MNELRFWAKVEKEYGPGGCWNWTAALANGYGAFGVDGITNRAHRVAWKLLRGDIPSSVVLDHLCENKSCVNPDHLDPTSNAENIRRHWARNPPKPKTKPAGPNDCPLGHPYTYKIQGKLFCRDCDGPPRIV